MTTNVYLQAAEVLCNDPRCNGAAMAFDMVIKDGDDSFAAWSRLDYFFDRADGWATESRYVKVLMLCFMGTQP